MQAVGQAGLGVDFQAGGVVGKANIPHGCFRITFNHLPGPGIVDPQGVTAEAVNRQLAHPAIDALAGQDEAAETPQTGKAE